ncbi:hypothetical protein nbrc107696_08300 [Gordonia spumicola]|uniref:Uncharacterized protein n=1 Tax=Gordonia spumicola TaxID=589161 RepID=A0A7I9V5C9_9ACTN|nr:hypothetical protein [Gordonia spumicola]GEE00384.1 hypothetical protein nbrc107696_08300 [Gordonia spumicola]
MSWEHFVDVADIVTAVSAVVAVVLATWLGRDAIKVARSGNDTAERDLRYNQIEHLLQDMSALAMATDDLVIGPVAPLQSRALERHAEAFDTRMQVLERLLPLDDHDAARFSAVNERAAMLKRISMATDELHRVGRTVLAETVSSGETRFTKDMLQRLVEIDWTITIDVRESLHAEPVHEDVVDFQQVQTARAFAPSFEAANELRQKLDAPDSELTRPESVRLFTPWVSVVLGIAEVDEDRGLVGELENIEFYEPERGPSAIDKARVERIDDWIGKYLRRVSPFSRWSHVTAGDSDEVAVVEVVGRSETPEQLARGFQRYLRDEFVREVVELVDVMRVKDDKVTGG